MRSLKIRLLGLVAMGATFLMAVPSGCDTGYGGYDYGGWSSYGDYSSLDSGYHDAVSTYLGNFIEY